jgi:hypothetical protein
MHATPGHNCNQSPAAKFVEHVDLNTVFKSTKFKREIPDATFKIAQKFPGPPPLMTSGKWHLPVVPNVSTMHALKHN